MTDTIYKSLTFPKSPVRYTAEPDPNHADFVVLRNAATGRKIGTIHKQALAKVYEIEPTPGDGETK